MTVGVDDELRIREYPGDDSATPRAYGFKILDPDDLRVTRTNADGSETVLVRGTHYSVSGAGNPAGGDVTPLAPIAAGTSWRIEGDMSLGQPTDYTAGDDFPAESHERGLDRAMIAHQEARRDIADLFMRALLLPRGEASTALPTMIELLGKFLSVDADGKWYAASGTGSDPAFRADMALLGDQLTGITGGGSLKSFLDKACYPDRFGLIDDPNYLNAGTRIDQSVALQAWFTYAATNRLSPRCHRPIRAYSSVSLTYDPSALIGGQKLPDIDLSNLTLAINATPGLTIGNVAAVVDGANVKLPNVRRSALSWVGSPQAKIGGIVLINFRYCTVNLGDVRGFPSGHQYWSEGFGFTLNTFIGGVMKDNRFQEAVVCTGVASYINENVWLGGSSGYGSDSTAQVSSAAIGTYFAVGTNGYKGSNNNRWYGRSYEGCESLSHPNIAECVPVWMEGCGAFNYWDKCRVEAWRGPIMHVRGDVNGDANASTGFFNRFDAGLVAGIGTTDGILYVRQVAGAYANTLSAPEHSCSVTWRSGELRNVLHSGGGANAPRVHAPFILREGTDATNYRQTSFSNRYQTNYFGIQMNNGVIGSYIDTSIHKDFEFTADTLTGFDGRWTFAAYDANFALLGATHTDAYATQRNIKFSGATFSTLYGGVYQTGADGAKPVQVTVSDPVKYLFFGPASGTGPCVCNGFSFKAFLRYGGPAAAQYLSAPPIFDPLTEGRPGIRLASANPATAGTHGFTGRGDITNNIGAVAGQPMGWQCNAGVALGVAFATATAFAVKGQVVICDGGTKAYYVKTPGTTSGAGTGPNGISLTTDYADGTVVFRYLGAKAAGAAMPNL